MGIEQRIKSRIQIPVFNTKKTVCPHKYLFFLKLVPAGNPSINLDIFQVKYSVTCITVIF
jgi:hypothetical protein